MPLPGTHNTIQLAIALDAARHELGIALLSLEGIVSFQEEDGLLLAYLPEQSWNPERNEPQGPRFSGFRELPRQWRPPSLPSGTGTRNGKHI